MAPVPGHAPSNLRGAAAMIAATGLFVVNDSFMKAAMAALPPFEVLFLRGVAAALCCVVMMAVLGQLKQLGAMAHPAVLRPGRLRDDGRLVLCRGPRQHADRRRHRHHADGAPDADPGRRHPDARADRRRQAGLILAGFVGAVMVAQPTASGVSVHALLAFATAAAIAARDLVGRRVAPAVPGFVVIFATILVVTAAAAAMTGLREQWVAPSGLHVSYLAAAGLFVMLGHFSIFLAYRYGTAGAVAPFFYAFAVWAMLVGYLVWHEIPNGLALLGIVFIVASGLAIVLIDRRARRLVEPRGEVDL